MSYVIQKTNGVTLGTILDGTIDTSHTSLTLIGRNYANYGQLMVNNFVSLLENFADNISPANPLPGQIWWNTSSKELTVWTGNTWQLLGTSFITNNTDASSLTPSVNEPTVDGLIRYNKSLNKLQVQTAGAWHTTHDSSTLGATGAYGPEQDPTVVTNTAMLTGQNYPVKWEAGLVTADVDGAATTGGYVPTDATADLGGVNLLRHGVNSGNEFNARFANIHSMQYVAYNAIIPGNPQSGDATHVDIGSTTNQFGNVHTHNITAYTSLNPGTNTVTLGTSTAPFNAGYINTVNANTVLGTTIGSNSVPVHDSFLQNIYGTNIISEYVSSQYLAIDGNGSVGSASIMPSDTQVYDIGSSAYQFNNVWGNTGNFNNINLAGVPIMQAIKGANTIPWTSLYNIPSTLYGMGITQVPWAMITNPPVIAPPGFDIPFLAGFNPDFSSQNLKLQVYGIVTLARNITFTSEFGSIAVAPNGQDVIVDILRNGSSIYSTRPQFENGSTLTNGVLIPSQAQCSAGDTLKFVVVQIGTSTVGAGLTFTLQGHERV